MKFLFLGVGNSNSLFMKTFVHKTVNTTKWNILWHGIIVHYQTKTYGVVRVIPQPNKTNRAILEVKII